MSFLFLNLNFVTIWTISLHDYTRFSLLFGILARNLRSRIHWNNFLNFWCDLDLNMVFSSVDLILSVMKSWLIALKQTLFAFPLERIFFYGILEVWKRWYFRNGKENNFLLSSLCIQFSISVKIANFLHLKIGNRIWEIFRFRRHLTDVFSFMRRVCMQIWIESDSKCGFYKHFEQFISCYVYRIQL